MIGLALIATGTGGIKPCVAAFGGDQVETIHFDAIAHDLDQCWYTVHSQSFLKVEKEFYLIIHMSMLATYLSICKINMKYYKIT